MNTTLHPLAEDYLARLDRAAWSLPLPDRAELLAEIRAHLEAGLPPRATDADVRNVLDGLGPPDDIVAAAQAPVPQSSASPPPAPAARETPWGTLEILAVLGLTVGTFVVPVIGPVVGLVLAWASQRWTHREKWVATLLTVLPVVVLALGALSLVTVRSDGGGGQPTIVEERAPVVPQTGAPS